jgi:membrane-associated phospholipid phosphatase
MGSKTNKTKSYPSGHATQSRLVGLYVASKFPVHKDGVMEAAKECGIGRVLAGFHYLSDYVCGNLLADKMFLVMNKDNYGKYIKGED